jgi:L-asparaginase
LVLLHGGAGGWDPKSEDAMRRATAALRAIGQSAIASLEAGEDPLEVTVACLKALETDEQFNAGRGSTLQADGVPRLSAALMDGRQQSFSGVISSTYNTHPSLLARHLQRCDARVLTAPGTELLARELGLPVASALTPDRIKRWTDRAMKEEQACDTVGALVRSPDGHLVAGTSTGGRGFEYPGRVSDSATVAGTYCSNVAGISATGTGEQIVDDAVAARLETRRRDGATLRAASESCFKEAMERGRAYGWIAHDLGGFWAVAHTTPSMSFVVIGAAEGEVAASRPPPAN